MVGLCSCTSLREDLRPVFQQFYQQVPPGAWAATRPADEPRITLTAAGIRLDSLIRILCDKTGVSVISSSKLDSDPITIEAHDQEVSKVLAGAARRLGCQLTKAGSIYFLGDLRPEDKGILARRVYRLDQQGLKDSIQTLLSEQGRVTAFTDGLLIVADRVEVLTRVSELIDQIGASSSSVWVIQYYLLQYTDSDILTLGLDTVPALQISASAATNSGRYQAQLTAGFNSVLRATRELSKESVRAEPLLLVEDGSTAGYHSGKHIPVAQKTVSPEGTVTTTGYSYVDTGLNLDVTVRSVSPGSARIKTEFSLSDVVDYVDSNPVTETDKITSTAVVNTGGVYLLGYITRFDGKAGQSGIMGLLANYTKQGKKSYLYMRACLVGSGVETSNFSTEPAVIQTDGFPESVP